MWWETLTLLQKVFFCIACPASVFLIIQIILLLIGFGGEGEIGDEVDITGDGDVDVTIDADSGLSLFTIKGLTAFFTVGGWVGFTLGDDSTALAIVLSIVCGSVALVLMALIMKWLIRLQSNGNVQLSEAIGKIADVYLTIPAKNNGEGKISLTLNERLIEMNAIQNGDEPIKTGSKVKVVEIVGNTYVVEKI